MNANIETAIDPAIAARIAIPSDHILTSDDGELRAVFSWRTDRYAHDIHAGSDRQLSSIEGTPADVWPASAAISQLSTERIDGRPTILGVGCSGTTHFSVSVQLDDAADGKPEIVFDWAARLAKPLTSSEIATESIQRTASEKSLAWLGSTYHQPTIVDDHWNIVTTQGTRLDHDVAKHNQRLRLGPVQMTALRTVVWSYRVRFN